ncbi:hypothetical protein Poli38472_008170 [Pythium oligandrum]|uniref:WRKY19-like zinc finger domain-containing protein n=1 Tax=Pythium oligandrum TaxID=41045 RepID=A0A8K1CNI8_PYTOL|nr:hypothetical protein Poli38472_008170 [Pythium oligandrum]|eukprot:TMW65528.1 hypothetical protein Poli38472_008170 [Pythium oligandrum]
MEMLLAPLDDQYGNKMWPREQGVVGTVRLPSLFMHSTGGATSPLRSPGMDDVLSTERSMRTSSAPLPQVVRLPSIGSIMRREESPCSSPKGECHEPQNPTLSPAHKQNCMEIYRQLQPPSPSEGALKNLLAGAALSQLATMQPANEAMNIRTIRLAHGCDSPCDAGDRSKRSNSAKLCGMEQCKKRAKAGGYCIAHGGGLRCSEEGCQKHAVSLGLCISHGGGKRCTVDGCLNASRKNGVCWSHGGKRLCKLEGCNKGPKSGGYCWSHGGKMKK